MQMPNGALVRVSRKGVLNQVNQAGRAIPPRDFMFVQLKGPDLSVDGYHLEQGEGYELCIVKDGAQRKGGIELVPQIDYVLHSPPSEPRALKNRDQIMCGSGTMIMFTRGMHRLTFKFFVGGAEVMPSETKLVLRGPEGCMTPDGYWVPAFFTELLELGEGYAVECKANGWMAV